MKKIFFSTLIIATLVFGSYLMTMSADNTYRPGWYDDKGFTLSQMLVQGIDSSTVSGYLIKRRTATVPLTLTTAAAGDTFYCPLLTVPAGMTFTVESITLTAAVEATGVAVALGEITYTKIVADTTALDTVVAKIEMDADSAIVYADTVYTMTLLDSVFTAGSIISWHQYNEGACTIEAPQVTITYRQKE
jgi:hypothetical protein